MAGFFGLFDYTKHGPGVPKDGPPKPRIKVFFEILGRKFWNLMRLNLLFCLFNIPAIITMIYIVNSFYFRKMLSDSIFIDFVLKFAFGSIFLCIPLITIGPAQAGFTYVLRNYAREEHAFIWWDFKENTLKNMKQGLIVSIIDLFIILVIGLDINIYITMGKDNGNIFFTLASGFLILAFITYIMMHMYIYPMMVTFKLSIKQIYKNALIFALIGFLPNLGILVICALILGITFLIYPPIGIILFPLITMSLIGLITNFFVYPKLKKYMIDKAENTGKNAVVQE
ncbi:MAG: DUF624 domain-containing protein [Clostridia bacterium]|nr:DUF624 domain-containing protein [Clostridia bacterium]